MYHDELYHFGIKGQKWGTRRYQNEDGSYNEAGKARYNTLAGKAKRALGVAAGAAGLAAGAYMVRRKGLSAKGLKTLSAKALHKTGASAGVGSKATHKVNRVTNASIPTPTSVNGASASVGGKAVHKVNKTSNTSSVLMPSSVNGTSTTAPNVIKKKNITSPTAKVVKKSGQTSSSIKYRNKIMNQDSYIQAKKMGLKDKDGLIRTEKDMDEFFLGPEEAARLRKQKK